MSMTLALTLTVTLTWMDRFGGAKTGVNRLNNLDVSSDLDLHP